MHGRGVHGRRVHGRDVRSLGVYGPGGQGGHEEFSLLAVKLNIDGKTGRGPKQGMAQFGSIVAKNGNSRFAVGIGR
jgi:hypothetical protein